jgi:hypothetical protein
MAQEGMPTKYSRVRSARYMSDSDARCMSEARGANATCVFCVCAHARARAGTLASVCGGAGGDDIYERCVRAVYLRAVGVRSWLPEVDPTGSLRPTCTNRRPSDASVQDVHHVFGMFTSCS